MSIADELTRSLRQRLSDKLFGERSSHSGLVDRFSRVGARSASGVREQMAYQLFGELSRRVEGAGSGGKASRYSLAEVRRQLYSRLAGVDRYERFREEDHPRDADGKFAEKAGGKPKAKRGPMEEAKRVGKGKDAKVLLGSGQPAPDWIKPNMIPPAWTDVKVSMSPDADVLVTARDQKGRIKTVYSDNFTMRTAAVKFARVAEGIRKLAQMLSENHANRKNPELRDNADCTWLMMEQATRPGSEADTKGVGHLYGQKMTAKNVVIKEGKKSKSVAIKVKGETVPIRDRGTADEILRRLESGESLEDSTFWLNSYGATTLEARHVVEAEDGVRLQFVGKEGVWHDHKIRNPDLANMLVERKKRAEGPTGKLFPGTSYSKVTAYAKTLDGGSFTPKDWRTIFATDMATKMVEAKEFSGGEKEYRAAVMEVAKEVSSVLGNRPAQALASYIDPNIFMKWKANCTDCA